MPHHLLSSLLAVGLLVGTGLPLAAQNTESPGDRPRYFVPAEDLRPVLERNDYSLVEMTPAAYASLLEKTRTQDAVRQRAQVVAANYQAVVTDKDLQFTGTLTVRAVEAQSALVPLNFQRVGLQAILLDGQPAKLSLTRGERGTSQPVMALLSRAAGKRVISLQGDARLNETNNGGLLLDINLPDTAAGEFAIDLPGNQDVFANVPVLAREYDTTANRTRLTLALGGRSRLRAVFLGSEKEGEGQAILLSETATTISLSPDGQTLQSMAKVQVLRKGVRELAFTIDQGQDWVVTDVQCPGMTRWDIESTPDGQTVVIDLSRASQDARQVSLTAYKQKTSDEWSSPRIRLRGAAFERGFLLLNTGDRLAVRGESLDQALRQDLSNAAAIPGLAGNDGRLYFHWGEAWQIDARLARLELERETETRHRIEVDADQVTMRSRFEITAVGQPMFATQLLLPPTAEGWKLDSLKINNQTSGFSYQEQAASLETRYRPVIDIQLDKALPTEGLAEIELTLTSQPGSWRWEGAAARGTQVELPVTLPQAEVDRGRRSVGLVARGDLSAVATKLPKGFEMIRPGKLSELGFDNAVNAAWSYDGQDSADDAQLTLTVGRREPIVTALSCGLVNVTSSDYVSQYAIDYTVARASIDRLFLLTDKRLGREISFQGKSTRLANTVVVEPSPDTVALSPAEASQYNLWRLQLDGRVTNGLSIAVRFNRPSPDETLDVPLIRPTGISQVTEFLGVQTQGDIAAEVTAQHFRPADLAQLPDFYERARRLVAAFRAERVSDSGKPGDAATAGIPSVSLKLERSVVVETPAAIAHQVSALTRIGSNGEQLVKTTYHVVNGGQQFMTFQLPEKAEVLSLSVSGEQRKPGLSPDGQVRTAIPYARASFPVEIVYRVAGAPSLSGNVPLALPETPGVVVNEVTWSIDPPKGWDVVASSNAFSPVGVYYDKGQAPGLPYVLQQPGVALLFLAIAALVLGIGVFFVLRKVSFWPSLPVTIVGAFLLGFVALLFLLSLGTRTTSVFNTINDKLSMAEDVDEGRSGTASAAPEFSQEEIAPARRDNAEREVAAKESEEARPHEQEARREQQFAQAQSTRRAGRVTLPVALSAEGNVRRFHALNPGAATAQLIRREQTPLSYSIMLVLTTLGGLAFAWRQSLSTRLSLLVLGLAMVLPAFIAIWIPSLGWIGNGLASGAVLLGLIWAIASLGSRFSSEFTEWTKSAFGGRVALAWSRVSALVVVAVCLAGATTPSAMADGKFLQADSAAYVPYDSESGAPSGQPASIFLPREIVRQLEAKAEAQAQNLADAGVRVSSPRFKATLEGEQLRVVLTAGISVELPPGRGEALLPFDGKKLALVSAELNGQPVAIRGGSTADAGRKKSSGESTALVFPRNATGTLTIDARVPARISGRKGLVEVTLPRLPAAVLELTVPEPGLTLDAEGASGAVQRIAEGAATRWTVALGDAGPLRLKWQPKAGESAADRTLSAQTKHKVYAFHWALVGHSRFDYTFPAGEHDQFEIEMPTDQSITSVEGSSVREFEVSDVDDRRIVRVRLRRAVKKSADFLVRWVTPLPEATKASALVLPVAKDAGRQSGQVSLYAAHGVDLKVEEVTGARRIATPDDSTQRAAFAETTRAVSAYEWPFAGWSLSYTLNRDEARREAHINQLVRLSLDDIQILAKVEVTAKRGSLYAQDFLLPAGYEVLSVTGALVEGHHTQPTENGGQIVHVDFRRATDSAELALAAIRREPVKPGPLAIPTMMAVNPEGDFLPNQRGQVALQSAITFWPFTTSARDLNSIPRDELGEWLEPSQRKLVSHAYEFRREAAASGNVSGAAAPSVELSPKAQRELSKITTARVITAVAVQTVGADYVLRTQLTPSRPLDQFAFSLPTEIADDAVVNVPRARSVQRTGNRWAVTLNDIVVNAFEFQVEVRLPLTRQTKTLPVPNLLVEEADSHHRIVMIQNKSRHQLELKRVADEWQSVPAEDRAKLGLNLPSDLSFLTQSFRVDAKASLDVQVEKEAKRIAALIDLMQIRAVVDRGGQARYEVTLDLINRNRQFVTVLLPEGFRVWSAEVAGEPVKPVTAETAESDGGAGSPRQQIRLPLIKTSASALPFEVKFFLAGQLPYELRAGWRVDLPAPEITDIDVQQTTWSLALPDDLDFIWPRGNMSAIAGVAEAMNFGIESKLRQLNRYTDDVASGSWSSVRSSKKTLGKISGSFSKFNSSLSSTIADNEAYLRRNERLLDRSDVQRLRAKLVQQRVAQRELIRKQEALLRASATDKDELTRQLSTTDLRRGSSVAELNEALRAQPAFLAEAQQELLKNIRAELRDSLVDRQHASQRQSSIRGIWAGEAAALLAPARRDFLGADAGSVLDLDVATNMEMEGILSSPQKPVITSGEAIQSRSANKNEVEWGGGLVPAPNVSPSDEMAQQMVAMPKPPAPVQVASSSRALNLQSQLDTNVSNRLQRMYSNAPAGQTKEMPQSKAEARKDLKKRPRFKGKQVRQQLRGGEELSEMVRTEEEAESDAVAADSFSDDAPGRVAASATPPPAEPEPKPEDDAFVARGITSLPIELPKREMRYTFACPGGNPSLSLLATDPDNDERLSSSVGLVFLLMLVVGLSWYVTRAKNDD